MFLNTRFENETRDESIDSGDEDEKYSFYIESNVNKKRFLDVEMDCSWDTKDQKSHCIGTTGLGPCVAFIFFMKDPNYIVVHHGALTLPNSEQTEEVEKCIKELLKEVQINLESVESIFIIGGAKDKNSSDIPLVKGLENLRTQEKESTKAIDFFKKLEFCKIGVCKYEFDDKSITIQCNVFSEIKDSQKFVKIEYVANIKQDIIVLALYQINLTTKQVFSTTADLSMNRKSGHNFDEKYLGILQKELLAITEAYETVKGFSCINERTNQNELPSKEKYKKIKIDNASQSVIFLKIPLNETSIEATPDLPK